MPSNQSEATGAPNAGTREPWAGRRRALARAGAGLLEHLPAYDAHSQR
jgi:hypothetical protein